MKQEGDNKRFDPSSEQKRRSWNLPESMAEYVQSNFRRYIRDATLHETVLDERPVPNDMAKVNSKKRNSFIEDRRTEPRKIFFQNIRIFEEWKKTGF